MMALKERELIEENLVN